MIVERASALHAAGMTMFTLMIAYGWNASISRQVFEMDDRSRTLDLVALLRSRYDLDSPRID